jgi:hypothetical protein
MLIDDIARHLGQETMAAVHVVESGTSDAFRAFFADGAMPDAAGRLSCFEPFATAPTTRRKRPLPPWCWPWRQQCPR